jgi:hypothetical protein
MKTRRNRKRRTRRGGLFGNLFGPSASEKADKEADIILATLPDRTSILGLLQKSTNVSKLIDALEKKITPEQESLLVPVFRHYSDLEKAKYRKELSNSWY